MNSAHPCIFVLPALGVAPGYYAPFVNALLEATQAQVEVQPQRAPQTWTQKLGGTVSYGYPEMAPWRSPVRRPGSKASPRTRCASMHCACPCKASTCKATISLPPAPRNSRLKMSKWPECGAHAVIRKDGCEYCTQCGHLGACG